MLSQFGFLGGLLAACTAAVAGSSSNCRSQPGDPSFPTADQLAAFNSSIDGQLVSVVPSAAYCHTLPGGCSQSQWTSAVFRDNIIGATVDVNWEQRYTSNPPSICYLNSTSCGQGSVPIYGVNATSVAQIQLAVQFANAYNLRLAIKSSGHDFLGRSTAPKSILIWTRHFQDITFTNSFKVGGVNKGSAVSVGSGVQMRTLYAAAKAHGVCFVGTTSAATVSPAGYIQGGGHSSLAPLKGLAADNVIEIQIVIANGSLVIANEHTNSDLFWAARGGGAGNWGIILTVTLRTFPTFNAVHHHATIVVNSSDDVATVSTAHARHIFDTDSLFSAQFFYWIATGATFTLAVDTVFPNASIADANATLASFLQEVTALGFAPTAVSMRLALINDVVSANTDDAGGKNRVLGSRLIPADTYRYNATGVGMAFKALLDGGASGVLTNVVAGGNVSIPNHNSAVNPKWRSAKSHVIASRVWADSTLPAEVEAIRQDMTNTMVPTLAALAGPDSGAYSNEGDVREPEFQATFYGSNYHRLSHIKKFYDPKDLFIVGAGVHSERWDADGLCRIGDE